MFNQISMILLVFVFLCSAGCDDKPSPDTNGKKGADQSTAKAYKASHPRVRGLSEDAAFITVATADRPGTLDPHNTESGGDVKVINQVYQSLVRIDPANVDKLIPELAESWAVADDGLSITFTIRGGVKFHDGAPLDAVACKQSLDRLRGAYLDVPAAPYRGFYDFIVDVQADGMKLMVKLNRPVARVALRNLTMFPASIVSPALLAATDGMDTGQRSTFISEWASGTGAYYLSKFDSAEGRVRLQAFDGWWDGSVRIPKIIFRHVADPNSQIEYIKSGEADMLDDVPRPVWDQMESDPKITLYRWWALNVCYLAMNVKHEKTGDIRLRKAIRLAVDRDKLNELYYGTARPTYSLVAQPFGEYDADYRAPDTEKDLAARQALARELLGDGPHPALKIYYPLNPRPYLPTPEKVADKLRQQMSDIGLNVEIVAVPNSELFDSIKTDKYEMVLIGWMSDNADADNFYVPLAGGDPEKGEPAPTNVGRAFDGELHAAMIAAQSITDADVRIEAYRKIERDFQEKFAAIVPLLNTQQAQAFGSRLEGVEVDALGHYRFHKAKLKE